MNNIVKNEDNISDKLDKLYNAIMIQNELELLKQLTDAKIINNSIKSEALRSIRSKVEEATGDKLK